MGWYRCGGGNGGSDIPVKWAKTTLFTGGTSSDAAITLSEDYHNYPILEFVCENSNDGELTNLITSPEILDNIFQYSTYVCFNEYNNNQYCCFSKTSNTVLSKYSTSRNLFVKHVNGLSCNGRVVKELIYERKSITPGSVTISDSNLTGYDFILLATCTGDNTETAINIAPYQNPLHTTNTCFISNYYNDSFIPKVSLTEISANEHWFIAQGLKVVGANPSEVTDNTPLLIFNNGEWHNQDIFNIVLSPSSLQEISIDEQGNLVFANDTGLSLNPIDANYKVFIFFEFVITANPSHIQTGTCAIGADGKLCMTTGYQRYHYRHHTFSDTSLLYLFGEGMNTLNVGLYLAGHHVKISKIWGWVTTSNMSTGSFIE